MPAGTTAYSFIKVSGYVRFESDTLAEVNVTTSAGVTVAARREYDYHPDGSVTLRDDRFGELRRTRVSSIEYDAARKTLVVRAKWEGRLGFIPISVPLEVWLLPQPGEDIACTPEEEEAASPCASTPQVTKE